MAKESYDVEGPGTINERGVVNLFRHFKEGDNNLEDKPRSEGPSFVEETVSE